MHPIALAICIGAFAVPTGSHAEATTAINSEPSSNRAVAMFDSTRTELTFPAEPTPEEIFRARVFEEPLVPVGGNPSPAENAALAAALVSYSKRSGPDEFSSLSGFLDTYPQSPWAAALLTDLGLEYHNTAHYSLALDAWNKAWLLAKNCTDTKGKAIADRAVGELIAMHARLGHMTEVKGLLKSVEGRSFSGPATERIANARGGLADMQERPEISFRCGPLALLRIVLATAREKAGEAAPIIHNSASTQRGFSLRQVAELSQKVGLNYQMARRSSGAAYIVPAVVHWKVGHYAALIRQEGDRYLLQDPTFRNDVWATKAALDAETSGYFVVARTNLPTGWTAVSSSEGDTVWGKGNVGGPEAGGGGAVGPPPPCKGMAVPSVDMLFISLGISDNPVGYAPPVGPAVRFTVHYNQRDPSQPANFSYSNFGSKWTFDWLAYITDTPLTTNADVQYYRMGGFSRSFTGFNPSTQTFALQLYDTTRLTRTSPNSYEMLAVDGSKLVFSQPDGSAGTSRKVFLTQIVDPTGNALTVGYDGLLRVVSVTDGIGQVTTLSYTNATDNYKITKVTDPFGRFATFEYDSTNRLSKITDVIGLTSQFTYDPGTDFINTLTTPYGATTFIKAESGTTRSLETHYPDGSRERAEFNQTTNTGISMVDAQSSVPNGLATHNDYLGYRNTFFWSRTGCATGYGDYSKAKIYHWLHSSDYASACPILESEKAPLEGRIWYNYPGQVDPIAIGTMNLPSRIARVLDDGSTQMRSFAYDGYGNMTNSFDPIGRTLTYIYATNGIDLLETRQTRLGKNELLSKMTYNLQHQPLTQTDAAGQTTTATYNTRGQPLTTSNPKGETTTNSYDANGYLTAVDGPLPGTIDKITATYDGFGLVQSKTDVSGYTVTFIHDAMDRITKITHPDSTYEQITFDKLNPVVVRDRAGRQTLMEYNSIQQMTKRTDFLGRATLFQWCSCGDLSSLTDPMGRTTSWNKDVQGRVTTKQYGDGSQIQYFYENNTSRLRQVIDEKQQVTQFVFNHDDTLKSISYGNAANATPGVSYTYDPDYERVTSMSDGTGTTSYSYNPITSSPVLGAGQLAAETSPLPNATIAYGYDELGRLLSTSIGGVASTVTYDTAGRIGSAANSLGSFVYAYDGASSRMLTETFPNGQNVVQSYGDNLGDHELQRITYTVAATPVSEFVYGRNIPAGRIMSWSQQIGAQAPSIYNFGYDSANQLISAAVTNSGALINAFGYAYDTAGNRLVEQANVASNSATYNALNELTTSTSAVTLYTNEWDAANRLVAVNTGTNRTEFTYDGIGRVVSVRKLTNGVEASLRRLLWVGNEISQERDSAGNVTKRFFPQGVRLETGANVGNYFYTRDHLGSIHDLTDSSGNVRARYAYDPFGRRSKLAGDLDADFGFTGLFWANEASLWMARFRSYDPQLARWLSRDPLGNAEQKEGPNLFTYVQNNPVNYTDPLGLAIKVNFTNPGMPKGCCTMAKLALDSLNKVCQDALDTQVKRCALAVKYTPNISDQECVQGMRLVVAFCNRLAPELKDASTAYIDCLVASQCTPDGPCNPVPAGGGRNSLSGAIGSVIAGVAGAGSPQGAAPSAGGGWSGPSLPPDVTSAVNVVFHFH
jgi:RHS repeat-associated protein